MPRPRNEGSRRRRNGERPAAESDEDEVASGAYARISQQYDRHRERNVSENGEAEGRDADLITNAGTDSDNEEGSEEARRKRTMSDGQSTVAGSHSMYYPPAPNCYGPYGAPPHMGYVPPAPYYGMYPPPPYPGSVYGGHYMPPPATPSMPPPYPYYDPRVGGHDYYEESSSEVPQKRRTRGKQSRGHYSPERGDHFDGEDGKSVASSGVRTETPSEATGASEVSKQRSTTTTGRSQPPSYHVSPTTDQYPTLEDGQLSKKSRKPDTYISEAYRKELGRITAESNAKREMNRYESMEKKCDWAYYG